MLAPFHLGKRDSGSKNIISINKLTNLFIKVIKNFLLLSPAGLCFPSLPTCSASCHYPPVLPLSHHPPTSVIIRFNFLTVIIRLDRIIHTAEHHFPSPAGCGLTGAPSIWIARSSRAMTLKESNRAMITKKSNRETKTKESSRETRKQTGQRQKRRNSPIKTKTPFCSDIPVKPECD